MSKERPILFSGAMVRALLDGSKTQTRRAVKPQPNADTQHWWTTFAASDVREIGKKVPRDGGEWCSRQTGKAVRCPYGERGDRLWVREAWSYYWGGEYLYQKMPECVLHRADGFPTSLGSRPNGADFRWRPSIHMPRWASRLTLEITDVRVQRLQDTSEGDAEAEGIDFMRHVPDVDETLSARQLYAALWDSINERRGFSWASNPWVWAITFKRLDDPAIKATDADAALAAGGA